MNVKDIIMAAFATSVIIPDTAEQARDMLRYNWREADNDSDRPGRPITGYPMVDKLSAAVEAMGVEYRVGYGGSGFDTEADVIELVDTKWYPSKLDYARTVLHETMHAIGFHTGAGRMVEGENLPYNGEEIVNETAVAALMDSWGYSNPDMVKYSTEYVANWWSTHIQHNMEWLIGPGPVMKRQFSGKEEAIASAAEGRYNKALEILQRYS